MNDTLPDKPSGDDQADEDQRVLRDLCLRVVGKQFDAVQIIATRYDVEDGTSFSSYGLGNHYARMGAVAQWMNAQKREAP